MTDIPKRIEKLREAAGLTQMRLAKELGVAQSLVSACESGKSADPPSIFLLKLGNLAADLKLYDEAVFFWKQAGVRVEGMVPAVLELVKELDAPLVQGSLTTVPANKFLQLRNKEKRVPFPTAFLPNPLAVSFVALDDDALEPMFKRGDVLIVDESDADPWKMIGSCVVTYRVASWNESVRKSREKLTDAEYEKYLSDRSGRVGFYAGWLRSISRGTDLTVAIESPNVLGGISSTPIAFEMPAIQGSSVKRKIDVPEFIVLGRIVASISGGVFSGSKGETGGSADKKHVKSRSKKIAKRKK